MPSLIGIPRFSLTVNGAALENNLIWQITRITVDDQVELPSMFTLELTANDETDPAPDWLDKDTLFAMGDRVVIRMGWGESLQTVMNGEVTSIEIEWLADSLPRFVVRGYDRRHRLQRGNKTRTFVKKKDSDIAKQITQESGLSAAITDTKIVHEYLIQANQTDFSFLQARARQLHYEMVMQEDRLYFQPVSYEKSAVLELTLERGLSEFRAQLSSAGQVSQAKVQGWDIKNKKAISTNATNPTSMGKTIGPNLTKKAFGQASSIITNIPTSIPGFAQQVADSALAASTLGLVRGEGQCSGNAKIKAGITIKVEGVGNRFSGKYYLSTVTHNFGPEGYATQFTGWRNAS
jgi:uncharacterized protein